MKIINSAVKRRALKPISDGFCAWMKATASTSWHVVHLETGFYDLRVVV